MKMQNKEEILSLAHRLNISKQSITFGRSERHFHSHKSSKKKDKNKDKKSSKKKDKNKDKKSED